MKIISKFARNRRGATVVEYCLIAGLIATGLVGAMSAIGQTTNNTFSEVNERVWNADH